MRIWFKIFKDNHLLSDYTYENYEDDTRTHKVFAAVDAACINFDLPHPIWLEANQNSFRRHAKTKFTQDSFIEEIDFDFLEIHVIEED